MSQRALCVCGVHTSVRLSVKLSMRSIAMRYHMLNFIAIDLQLYKTLNITLVSFFGTQYNHIKYIHVWETLT